MWCYQKPGFQDLLLTELQRQQQCSQFCDTVLTAGGLSVPAHSCVLSAISPHFSSSLSSKPAPSAGQRHHLEFQALSPSTLLRIVGLVYSGEMMGEGEMEKEEAVSAAAKLGIQGLVEVTKKACRSKTREEIDCFEVGVQTEPQILDMMHGSRWRRELSNGSVLLWKETLSNGGNDMQTQTEELQINTVPVPQTAASFETIDMGVLQGLRQSDSHADPQIVPISLIYPPNENQACQPPSTPAASVEESAAPAAPSVSVMPMPYTSAPHSLPHFSSQMTQGAPDHPNWWANPQSAVAGEWEDAHIEEFQSNIPGFINYFLNTEQEEGSHRGRAGRRRGARVSASRRGRTGERRARRPRARTGGMGQGALTQMVDVQEITVIKLQKLFLHKHGMRAPRTGQGGGAVGRKLHLKTRELLNPAKGRQRIGRSKVWELSESGDLVLCSNGRGGRSQRGTRGRAEQLQQDSIHVGKPQGLMTGSTTPVPSPFQPLRFCSTTGVSSPAVQPSPTTNLSSHAASYISPATSLLHTAPLPPPPPPPHEDQPERIDRLLEEVMLGLNILPNAASRSLRPLPASEQQQCYTNGTEVVLERGVSCSNTANGGAPVLQQQSDGELNEMLYHFLQSFEKHVGSCNAREEREMPPSSAEASQANTDQRKSETRQRRNTPCLQNTESQVGSSKTTKQQRDSINRTGSSSNTEGKSNKSGGQDKQPKKRRSKQYMFSLEKKTVRRRSSPGDIKNKNALDPIDKLLLQIPVVKLERRGLLQGHSWQSLQNKGPAETNSSEKLSSGKSSSNDRSEKKKFASTKTYPIRSRFNRMHILDSGPVLKQPHPADHKKRQPPSSSKDDRSPQLLYPSDEELPQSQERREEESTVEPQEERAEPLKTGQKRKVDLSEDTPMSKRVCLEPVPQQPDEGSCIPNSVDSSTIKQNKIIDVETVLLSIVGKCLQRDENRGNPVCCEVTDAQESLAAEEAESSSNEIIDVERDNGDAESLESRGAEKGHSQPRTAPILSHCVVNMKSTVSPSHSGFSVDSRRSWEEDEDIDVIGASSPVPDLIIINWTESSESGEEDTVDIIGEEN